MPTTYTYNALIPASGNAPKNDQPIMQQNATSIQGIITVDHENFGSSTNGYHTVIHQRTGAGTQNLQRSGVSATYSNIPSNIANTNQIIAGQYTPDTTGGTVDTQLFNLTGTGIISQLTGFLVTNTATSDGWQWVGGILLQWGFVATSGTVGSNSVTFKDRIPGAIPFPNNCFFVGPTLSFGSTTTASNISSSAVAVIGSSVSKTGFAYLYNLNSSSSSSSSRGFYWFAIGN